MTPVNLIERFFTNQPSFLSCISPSGFHFVALGNWGGFLFADLLFSGENESYGFFQLGFYFG